MQRDKSTPVEVIDVDKLEQRARSIVTVRGSISVQFSSDSFSGNFVVDDFNPDITHISQSTEVPRSNAVLVMHATGEFSMNGV